MAPVERKTAFIQELVWMQWQIEKFPSLTGIEHQLVNWVVGLLVVLFVRRIHYWVLNFVCMCFVFVVIGYQHYDFCVVKELVEPATKLEEQQQKEDEEEETVSETDKDKWVELRNW